MTPKFDINDTVQFVENHKWCGCYGTIKEIKNCGGDIRYLIGVPIPTNDDSPCPISYILSMESEKSFERIGRAILIPQPYENSI